MLQSKEHIGRLDKRITFQSETTATDVSNADAETGWEDVKTTWAKVEPSRGSEQLQSDQVKSVHDLTITVRTQEVKNEWRISYAGKFYEIDSVEPPDRNGYMKIGVFLRQDYV